MRTTKRVSTDYDLLIRVKHAHRLTNIYYS